MSTKTYLGAGAFALILTLFASIGSLAAQQREHLILTTPAARMAICFLTLDMTVGMASASVHLMLCEVDANGEVIENGWSHRISYDQGTVPTGEAIIRALNTADLSTRSLNAQLIQRIQADFPKFGGALAGDPVR